MLFDLRGRGRRHTVQVIYLGLALLMAVGLIGFGIGGGFGGGGLLNVAGNNEGGAKASFSSQIDKYRKLTKRQPGDLKAWEELINAELHEAGGEAYVQNNQLTSKGREIYTHIASSWSRYLALNPPHPNSELAERMVTVLGEEGLDEAQAALRAVQIVVAARPNSASLYASLANYAYKANDTGVGDLASQKAVSLAPADQRAEVKNELAKLKEHPNGESEETKTSQSGEPFDVKTSTSGKITATPGATTTGTTPSKKK